jgi:hypothetical protein
MQRIFILLIVLVVGAALYDELARSETQANNAVAQNWIDSWNSSKPARSNRKRHGSFLFLPILPAFRGRHGYRLAFVVSSTVLTRDSTIQAALSECPANRQDKRGGTQTPSSHPA